jgi:nitrite reductase (NADH) small subunit
VSAGDRDAGGPGRQRVVLGRLNDHPDGVMRIVEAAGRSIGVYRRGDELFAVQNLCPHQLAPVCAGSVGGTMLPSAPGELVYGLEGYVLRCPAHGWEFDVRTGETLFGVDRRRLLTFPVRIEDGEASIVVRPRGPLPEAGS